MAHLPFSEKYISQMRSLTLSCVSPRGVRGVGYSWLSARSRGRVECSFWLGGRGIRNFFWENCKSLKKICHYTVYNILYICRIRGNESSSGCISQDYELLVM